MNQLPLLLTHPPECSDEAASDGFCSCKASIHKSSVNKMLDFLYVLATTLEHQDANRKKRKTTRNRGGAS